MSLEGVDKNGSLLGTVLHTQGNISIELVKVGLARVVDWSSQMTPAAPMLRGAERGAKERKLRIWKDYVAPNLGGDMAEFGAKVVEVFSGDTLIVVDDSKRERRVTLSSLRCPRMGREPEPYAAESKENLRRMLIGKKVKVVPEYKRTFAAAEGATPQERVFVSVFYNNERNAAVVQLEAGLAVVSKHGQSDERSLHYELLLEAETEAVTKKKGLHASGEPPRSSVTDLTTPDARERAKRFIPNLTRHGRVRAVVQFIPNGARRRPLKPCQSPCVGPRASRPRLTPSPRLAPRFAPRHASPHATLRLTLARPSPTQARASSC